ncbi:uncharacterized protein PSFLO_03496 [Pseudozyma flocculosa]|uniref:Uncharacterized protein n=1 Tax=Pseudozyma flocculosa TaxID=84751 RepID=A0A5C3F3I1_9BASI|nr:uncharacterized protein PSFLO_03496 [Pseudozyma flocculosa]
MSQAPPLARSALARLSNSPSRLAASLNRAPSNSSRTGPSEGRLAQLHALQRLFDSDSGIDSALWRSRLARTIQSLQQHSTPGTTPAPLRVLIAGSSLSRTADVVVSLFDEPLREQAAAGRTDLEVLRRALSQPGSTDSPRRFTVQHGFGPAQWSEGQRNVSIDRNWLLDANIQLTVILDPTADAAVHEAVYDSDIALFVTDSYALEQALVQASSGPSSNSPRSPATLDLASQFASKPNVHVIVNQLTDLAPQQHLAALEAAIGPAAVEQLAQSSSSAPLLAVSAADAIAANAALRQALTGPDVESSSRLWDEFSGRFTASKVADVHRLIQGGPGGRAVGNSLALVSQSAQVVIDHCISDVVSFCASASASFERLLAVSAALQSEDAGIQREAHDRVWPSMSTTATKRRGALSGKVKSWSPTGPGSASAIDEALAETADSIASTMERRLQWWKLVWKVDDIRAELEGVCAGFAASLESVLAYESGRLAALQVQQADRAERALTELRSVAARLEALRGTSRDAALFANDAEAVRSREARQLTPATLLEPIEQRREQLLRVGGPIDVLAGEARKLAVTTYAALGATGAGLGSASIMGASLGTGPLSMEPSTALALSLLICTAAAWRVQGRFAKIKARFWQDWDRLAEGLDHEVKDHLDTVLERDVVGPTCYIATGLSSLKAKWQRDVATVEARLRSLSAATSEAAGVQDRAASGAMAAVEVRGTGNGAVVDKAARP